MVDATTMVDDAFMADELSGMLVAESMRIPAVAVAWAKRSAFSFTSCSVLL